MNNMELLVNDLSIQGQFPDIESFRKAIIRLMGMRKLCRRFGLELYCHKNLANAQVTNNLIMLQAIQHFPRPEKSALMQWLTRRGPYWEDYREHGADDYLECKGQLVTDSAIGEAAFRCFHADIYQLVSMTPSDWVESPLAVWWRDNGDIDKEVSVINHLNEETIEEILRTEQTPLESWEQLEEACRTRFININFAKEAFLPLSGYPFVQGAAQRIIERLDILDRYKCCFDENGNRSPEGNQLYQDYFTGDKAWFSDSSDGEKRDFKSELTFKHPEKYGETLFCPMHGKVKTPQIRIHFSWPVTADSALYIVYVGYKITKR